MKRLKVNNCKRKTALLLSLIEETHQRKVRLPMYVQLVEERVINMINLKLRTHSSSIHYYSSMCCVENSSTPIISFVSAKLYAARIVFYYVIKLVECPHFLKTIIVVNMKLPCSSRLLCDWFRAQNSSKMMNTKADTN